MTTSPNQESTLLLPRSKINPSLVSAIFCLLIFSSTALTASPLLRCQIKQGGKTINLEATPTKDPYTVKAIEINGRFRFKAVVIGSAEQLDYIKLYTYYTPSRQPVLVHQATYLAPIFSTGNGTPSLTGINTVCSPALEREMQYQCTLVEVAP